MLSILIYCHHIFNILGSSDYDERRIYEQRWNEDHGGILDPHEETTDVLLEEKEISLLPEGLHLLRRTKRNKPHVPLLRPVPEKSRLQNNAPPSKPGGPPEFGTSPAVQGQVSQSNLERTNTPPEITTKHTTDDENNSPLSGLRPPRVNVNLGQFENGSNPSVFEANNVASHVNVTAVNFVETTTDIAIVTTILNDDSVSGDNISPDLEVNTEKDLRSDIASIIESLIDVKIPLENSMENIFNQSNELGMETNKEPTAKATRLHHGTVLQRDENSPLQQLLRMKMKITTNEKNKTDVHQGPKSTMSTEENNEKRIKVEESIKNATDDQMIFMLKDIKNILNESESKRMECSLNDLSRKYEILEVSTIDKVKRIQENLNTFTENTSEKMNLVLDNLSTMKILMTTHSSLVQNNFNKITELSNDILQLKTIQNKSWTELAVSKVASGLLQPLQKFDVNSSQFNQADMFVRLSKQVDSNEMAINSTFFTASERITKLESSFKSYEKKINQYFLGNSPDHSNLITNFTNYQNENSMCNCNNEILIEDLVLLKEKVASQSDIILKIQTKTNTMQSNFELLQKNKLYLLKPASNRTAAKLSNNTHTESNIDSSTDNDLADNTSISNTPADTPTSNSFASNVECAELSERVSMLEAEVSELLQLRSQLQWLREQLEVVHNRTGEKWIY